MPKTRHPAIRGKPLQFNDANAVTMAEPNYRAIEKPAANLHSPPTSPMRE